MGSMEQDFDAFAMAADSAVVIVTARSQLGEHGGCLVGFTTQCSINPRRYLVCLSDKNHTYEVALSAEHLAVHLIPRPEMALAHLFAEETGDSIDKFDRCAWAPGPHGLPILEGASAWFVGRIHERVPLGDHVGHVLEVVAADQREDAGDVLRLHDVIDFDPGHEA